MKTKDLLTILILTLLLWTSLASFPDIQWHKYQESIEYLESQNVVKWYDDWTFWPDREINRAEILKIILESSLGNDIQESKNCFPDIQNQRYAKYVCYAKKNNIVKWYDDGTFWPTRNVINAEALKMNLESFGFDEKAWDWERWYQWYIDFVHNNNIFSKYSLRAEKNMTRWEMAYLTHQLMLEKEWKITFDWIRDIESEGCWTTPDKTPTSLQINGKQRNFITSIWNKYNKNTPTKLIVAFHGRTNSNERVRTYYNIEEASKGNAIIIYPSGLPENSSPRNRSNGGDPSDQLRDFALFDAIIEEFKSKYCINKDQIFVVWHSLWARFTNSLSCARGDVIRAIWSIWWSTTINDCSWPTAAIIMHNPADNLAWYQWGITARNQILNQNACDSSKTTAIGPTDWHCVKYTDCQSGAPVIRCPHTENYTRWYYYPHSRPSFAGQMIRDFFEKQK